MSKAAQGFSPEAYLKYVEGGNPRRTPLIGKKPFMDGNYLTETACSYAAANERTRKISFSDNGAIADSGTVITAIVSPTALNTSNE